MTQKQQIQLFGEKKVRSVWDSEQEKWYFSIVDVCHILTDQPDYDHAKNYWKVLKFRLVKGMSRLQTVTNWGQYLQRWKEIRKPPTICPLPIATRCCQKRTTMSDMKRVNVAAKVFYGFFFSVKAGPKGCWKESIYILQASLQDVDGVLLTQPCKMHGCFTEKRFSAGFFQIFVPLCLCVPLKFET